MTDMALDLNQTITSAVNARIEAALASALAGDEVMGSFVTAALQQTVEISTSDPYRKAKVPFLTSVLHKAIQDATKAAVTKMIAEEIDSIEAEVRKALRRDLGRIAGTLSKSLVDAADKTYGVSVALDLKMPSRD